MTTNNDVFGAKTTIDTPLGERTIYQLDKLGEQVNRLPYCIKVLLEACLRNCDGYIVSEDAVNALANYDAASVTGFYRRAGGGRSGCDARRDAAHDR
jgi:aconitate hydratase